MRYPRNKHSNSYALVRNRGPANHTELQFGHRFEGRRGLVGVRCSTRLRPLHPLKKNILLCVSVLIGMEDVTTLFKNPAGDPRH